MNRMSDEWKQTIFISFFSREDDNRITEEPPPLLLHHTLFTERSPRWQADGPTTGLTSTDPRSASDDMPAALIARVTMILCKEI